MSYEELLNEVREARQAGTPEGLIRKGLLATNWTPEQIEQFMQDSTPRGSATTRPPLIVIQNVSKVYQPSRKVVTVALRGLTMDIYEGEFLAITGHSGSGKTTLLNLLALIDEPTEGEIIVQGQHLNTFSEKQKVDYHLRSVSLVFQFFNLLDNYTAVENIMFQLRLQGYSRRQSRRKAVEILGFLGLAKSLHFYPKDLSGGQQQRVAVGRALAKDSLFILADEPTAHLDEKNGVALIELLRKINSQFNRTVILVTHEPELTQQADRTVMLHDGTIASITSHHDAPELIRDVR